MTTLDEQTEQGKAHSGNAAEANKIAEAIIVAIATGKVPNCKITY